jgi:hypothetical protein
MSSDVPSTTTPTAPRSYFSEAFWKLFTDPAVLVALLTILIVAVLLPIAASYAFAIWQLWKKERSGEWGETPLEDDGDEEVEAEQETAPDEPDGGEGGKARILMSDDQLGAFNTDMIKALRHLTKDHEAEKKEGFQNLKVGIWQSQA